MAFEQGAGVGGFGGVGFMTSPGFSTSEVLMGCVECVDVRVIVLV